MNNLNHHEIDVSLTKPQKKHLMRLSHQLKPVVILGHQGLSKNVADAIDEALSYHELIKIKFNAHPRPERNVLIKDIVDTTQSTLIQTIGSTATIYRRNDEKPKISL